MGILLEVLQCVDSFVSLPGSVRLVRCFVTKKAGQRNSKTQFWTFKKQAIFIAVVGARGDCFTYRAHHYLQQAEIYIIPVIRIHITIYIVSPLWSCAVWVISFS